MKATLRLFSSSDQKVAVIDRRYPLTKTLSNIFGGWWSVKDESKSKQRVKGVETQDSAVGKRVEVVSEKLCGNYLSKSPRTAHGY